MPYDSSLFTVMNHVVADNMASNPVLVPVLAQSTENNLLLPLRSALDPVLRPFVMPGGDFFAEADACTFGLADQIILNNPALAPMGPMSPSCKAVGGAHWGEACRSVKPLTVM